MSENQAEHESEQTSGISDDQLPPDLVAGEDNPLAEGLPDGEGDDLLEGGKSAVESSAEPDGEEKRSGPAGEHD